MNALAAPVAGWRGCLDLGYVRGASRTELRQRGHRGPLCVQRPFYPEAGGVCHTYLLHPPGGLVGGDEIALSVNAGPGTQVLLTTPGATKGYRSSGARATVAQTLTVTAGATLEWLPQETLFFDGARVQVVTRVMLAGDAHFIGWEMACLGRPASGLPFRDGALDLRFELLREGKPFVLERLRVDPAVTRGGAPASWRGHLASGTLYAVGAAGSRADPAVLDSLREVTAAAPHPAGVSVMSETIVCRALAPDALDLRQLFVQLWAILRQGLCGRAACAPRIWQT